MVLRILISLIFACYQRCEGCHGLLPSCDQLAGIPADMKVCLCHLAWDYVMVCSASDVPLEAMACQHGRHCCPQ